MRKQSMVLLLVLLSLVVLLLAACGGGQAASGPTEVHVKMTEFEFQMDKTSIPAGPVKFIFDNAGKETHEAVLEPAGANDEPFSDADGKESEVEDVEVGTSKTLEWTLEPGEYQLGCHINENGEDHFELGMVQTFTVTAN